jgi:hypothetical protein
VGKYEAVTSVYETVKNTQHVRRPGTVIELSDEDAKRLVEIGAVKLPSGDPSAPDPEPSEPVELPARPSNGAAKAEWAAYLVKLDEVTRDELGPLDVPADATRDQMIQIGDTRVAEWNEQ